MAEVRDYLAIGGGSAGCIVAAEKTADVITA